MDDDSDAATLTSDRPIRSMTLKAGDGGYGFTLQGSAPVVVQRVEAGSVAEKAGLRGGDVIMELNGHNTHAADHHTVVNIIYYTAGTPLTLTVQSQNADQTSTVEKEDSQQEKHVQFLPAWKDVTSPVYTVPSAQDEIDLASLQSLREIRSLSPDIKLSPQGEEMQALLARGPHNTFVIQPALIDNPNAAHVVTSTQPQKGNKTLSSRLSHLLLQTSENGSHPPTIECIGKIIVMAAIENAVDITKQWPDRQTDIEEKIEVDECIVGNEVVQHVPINEGTTSNEAVEMPEASGVIQTSRKRGKQDEMEEMDVSDVFLPQVKRSKAEMLVESTLCASIEANREMDSASDCEGSGCKTSDNTMSKLICDDTMMYESSLVIHSCCVKPVDVTNRSVVQEGMFGPHGIACELGNGADRNGSAVSLPSVVWQWGAVDVGVWLSLIGMKKYEREFRDVSGANLLAIEKQSLYDMGMTSEADIQHIMDAITSLRQSVSSKQETQTQCRKLSRPASVYDWQEADVTDWLESLGEQYTPHCALAFQKHEVNGHVLLRLTDSSLVRIGINNPLLRTSLLQHIMLVKFHQEELELKKLLADS